MDRLHQTSSIPICFSFIERAPFIISEYLTELPGATARVATACLEVLGTFDFAFSLISAAGRGDSRRTASLVCFSLYDLDPLALCLRVTEFLPA